MNWDEKAEDYAGAHHTYEHRSPEDNRLIEKEIVHGARWQRDQLRTDEAIERVAESIWTTDPESALEPFDGPETWEVLEPELKDDYRHAARHAITALLGEEP